MIVGVGLVRSYKTPPSSTILETVEKVEGKVIECKTKLVDICATHRVINAGQRTGKEKKDKLRLCHGKG